LSKSVSGKLSIAGRKLTLISCGGIVLSAWLVQQLRSIERLQLFGVFACLLFAFFLVFYAIKKSSATACYLSFLIFTLCLGFTRAWIQAQQRLDLALPVLTERVQADVSGCISSLPQLQDSSTRFLFDVTDNVVNSYPLKRIRLYRLELKPIEAYVIRVSLITNAGCFSKA